jgi:hypothetical protein
MNLRRTIAPSLAPKVKRGYRREEAADYLGVSPSKFDELREAGRLPLPRKIDSIKVWDVRELDSFFNELPVDTAAPANSWDDYEPEGADDSP